MRDYMSIGSAPCDEPCVQVTPRGDYHDAMKAECRRFLDLIRKKLGEEPPGARLAVKGNPYDFGTYYEVGCHFDDGDEEAYDYALACESSAPQTWSDDHLSSAEAAHIAERKRAREGVCRECGEEFFDDPEGFSEHVMEHVRARQRKAAA